MRAHVLVLLAGVACGSSKKADDATQPPARTDTTVRVDRRVELLSLIARLAKYDEYLTAPATPYVQELDKTFKKAAEHAAVTMARDLRKQRGISHDAVMIFAVHLDEHYQLRNPDELAALDARWKGVDAAAFAGAVRTFAADVDFDAFFDKHGAANARVADTLRTVVDAEDPVAWFDGVFGPRTGATYTVVPGLAAGTWNFGVRFTRPDGGVDMYQILGIRRRDGTASTDADTVWLLVHEMAHSYINPAFERHASELRAAGEKIYPLVEQRMAAQAYKTWTTMLNEAGVRAITTLYAREKQGATAGAAAARREMRNGFLWTNELAEVFRRKKDAHDIEKVMPDVAVFFDKLAVVYANGLPRTPFLGPIDAVHSDPAVVVGSAGGDDALARYLEAVHARYPFLAKLPMVTASDQTFADHAGVGLIAFGTPTDNPIVADVLERSHIRLAPNEIVVGARRFTGDGLVLAATWYRRDDSTRGIAIYTALRAADLVGVLENTSTQFDWSVARKTASGWTVLGTGDFPRAVDGAWTLP